MKTIVLVVEDNLEARQQLEGMLTNQGFHCISVGDGAEALQVLAKQKIDIVVSDVNIPFVDGFSLHKKVKKDYKDTEFILYTSADAPELERLAAAVGIKAFFSNSMSNLNQIVDRVNIALKRNDDITRKILDA